MLVPLRHITEVEITPEERDEYLEIKKSHIDTEYEYIFISTKRTVSIPDHFHMHLIVVKEGDIL
jgi:diadenosine tetraphosphate (Ap4A) HIT family hydrolase